MSLALLESTVRQVLTSARHVLSVTESLPTFELDGIIFQYTYESQRQFRKLLSKLRRIRRSGVSTVLPGVVTSAFS